MGDQDCQQKIPRRRMEVRVRPRRDRMLIALAADSRELDQVATFIWRRIDGTRAISAIAADVCAEYDVELSTALRDVTEFIRDLAAGGFLDLTDLETASGAQADS